MSDVVVFAGTTEGCEICSFLAKNKVSVLACVATDYGSKSLKRERISENPRWPPEWGGDGKSSERTQSRIGAGCYPSVCCRGNGEYSDSLQKIQGFPMRECFVKRARIRIKLYMWKTRRQQ